jgi:hypothetical protein
MKRLFWFLLPLLLLGGCAELFEFNLFRSLDPVPLPTRAELEAISEEEALNYLAEELASPVFMEKLREDGTAFSAVDDYLYASMSGSPDPESRKLAAVLYADLHLAASGAGEAVNNVASLLSLDLGTVDFADENAILDFLEELLPEIIPPEALASQEAFDAILSGFQDAWVGYALFGTELGADPAVSEGINLGDAAQKALFSFMVAEALRPGTLYATEEEARAALWTAAQGEAPGALTGSGAFADPFATGAPLQNILDAAGIDF